MLNNEHQLRKICKNTDFYGESVVVGNGTAQTWVVLDDGGRPTSVGLTISETALSGLPTDPMPVEYRLSRPKEASATPFDHVTLDWNAVGHEPDGIYNSAQWEYFECSLFDVHNRYTHIECMCRNGTHGKYCENTSTTSVMNLIDPDVYALPHLIRDKVFPGLLQSNVVGMIFEYLY